MATENDKVNTGALGTLVAVGTASMIGIALAVNALVRHEQGSIGALRDEAGADAYRALRNAQVERLEAPAAWSDKAKGHVSIPIERAMNIVLTDLKRSPWNATPAPPLDGGTDAAAERADAGTDAAPTSPEPPALAPLSPSAPTSPQPSGTVLLPPAPAPKPAPPAAPTAATPPAAPAPAAPPATH